MELRPDDRVLLLSLPSPEEVQRMASQASIIVGLVSADDVFETRRLLRERPNVMIAPADPEGTLPWKEEFFSVVYAPDMPAPSAEMLRVLVPGGTAWVAGGPVVKR